jgi:dienelactone hydrolase
MTAVEVLGSVDELADGTGGSVDAATVAASGPYRRSRFNKIYPGAGHAFDAQGRPRIVAGHPITPDPKAAADAWTQIVNFLRRHIGT